MVDLEEINPSPFIADVLQCAHAENTYRNTLCHTAERRRINARDR